MIAKAIAAYLAEHQIPAETLCAGTGMSEESLRAALSGERSLGIEEYLSICAALNLHYSYFFEHNTANDPSLV